MFIVPLSNLTPIQSLGQEETAKQNEAESKGSFGSIMQQAIENLQASQEASAQDAYNIAMGDVTDLHSMMINTVMETAAIETAVQVTSRAVSAYKEILQMQI